ncbi:MAG TPA: hypothetical protein DD761_03470 [Cyanobacteria bacterium UBA11691]|nr:hypothetical protein [Cyanobacteria bacterium UBA11691]
MIKLFIPLLTLFFLVNFSSSATASSATPSSVIIYEASCQQEEQQEGDWTLVPVSWRTKFPFSMLRYQSVIGQRDCFYMFNNYEEYPELFVNAPCVKSTSQFFNSLAAFSFTIASLKGFSK